MAKRVITITIKNTKLLAAAIDRMRADLLGTEPDAEIIDAVAVDAFPLLPAGKWWGCGCGYVMPEPLIACVKCGALRKE